MVAIEFQGVLGKEPRFAIDRDVVAVVAAGQTGRFHYGIAGVRKRGGEIGRHLDIARLIARRIGIRNVGGDDLLPLRKVTQEAAEFQTRLIQRHATPNARTTPKPSRCRISIGASEGTSEICRIARILAVAIEPRNGLQSRRGDAAACARDAFATVTAS